MVVFDAFPNTTLALCAVGSTASSTLNGDSPFNCNKYSETNLIGKEMSILVHSFW